MNDIGKLKLLSYNSTEVHELIVDDTSDIIAMLQQQLTYTVLEACLTCFIEEEKGKGHMACMELMIKLEQRRGVVQISSYDILVRSLFIERRRSPLRVALRRRKKREIEIMSWQTYVDEHLMCDVGDGQGHHLTAAAIIGHDGSVWAQSANFPQFKPQEITGIMKDFDEPGHLAPTGLFLAGLKYMVIQGEPGAVIRGKKGAGGITIKKTGQSMVFGLYEEPVTPGQCNMVVERLGDYLVEQGL
ncbi:unnamed protein product [Thlaspi arvense]|uniref:Profilin n=1 Tax=Thlaspi arvense TaxID=13288 RepID=A0AAU9RXJ4_THLAR|nr:unnamed protein product [Thlaspi arvense]